MPARLLLAGPAFFVAILGVALALAARSLGLVAALAVILAALVGGWIADIGAKRSLPARPRTAIVLFTLWSICPGIMAATFIAILIYLNATLDPVDIGMTGLDKEMLKTSVAAVSALLTALFIKFMDDADEKLIGEHVRNAFYASFRDSNDSDIPAGAYPVILGQSPLEAPVFDTDYKELPGWSASARWARAKAVAAGMKDVAERERVAAFRNSRRGAAAGGGAAPAKPRVAEAAPGSKR
jgi:hypothetical protein